MIRNLKTLGLALVAALALSAVVASGASAAPALFTAGVSAGPPAELAEIHGEQEGTDTFQIAGLPPMTCTTAKETGFPEEDGTHKAGPSAPSVTLTPTYGTCHIVLLFVTRTITVNTESCAYTFTATKNTNSSASGPTPNILTPFSADLDIDCPVDQSIKIHVYNTSNHNDSGAATLCTYDIGSQTINDQIRLTNIENADPTPDDVTADIHATVKVKNTILSGTCTNNENPHAIYKGSHTLRATNELDEFVHTTVS